MRKMRTIKEALRFLKESDKSFSITEYGLRLLCKENKIHNATVGRKRYLDLDELLKYLLGN